MKAKLTYILACFAAIWLLASCNSRNTLMKRHYMKGYYLERSTAKHIAPAQARVAAKAPVITQHKRIAPVTNEPIALAEAQAASAPKQASASKANVKKSARLQKRPAVYSLVPVLPNIRLSDSKQALNPVVRDDDGLSLFWAVILVIVILWAIGFLTGGFGLGNLIHLLLVVALILLILWLLRII